MRQRPDHARARPRRRACTSCTRTRPCSRPCRWPTTSPSAAAMRRPGPARSGGRALRRRTQALLDRYDIAVSPDALVRDAARRPSGPWWPSSGPCRTRKASTRACWCSTSPPPRCPGPRWRASWARSTDSPAAARPSCSSAIASTRSSTSPTGPRCCATVGWPARLEGDEITENRLIELIAGRALDRMYPEMPAVTDRRGRARGQGPAPADRCTASTSSCARARCSASPACSARAAPSCSRWCSAPTRCDRARSRSTAVRSSSATSARPWRPASPTCPRTAGAEAVFPELTLSENLAAAMVDRYWQGLRLRRRQADAERPNAIGDVLHPGLLGAPGDGDPVGWQPAEGDPGPLAASASPRCCCSTSRPRASTWTPGPRSTRWSVQGGRPGLLGAAGDQRLRGAGPRRRTASLVLTHGRVSAELRPPDIEPARLTELAFSTQEIAS